MIRLKPLDLQAVFKFQLMSLKLSVTFMSAWKESCTFVFKQIVSIGDSTEDFIFLILARELRDMSADGTLYFPEAGRQYFDE